MGRYCEGQNDMSRERRKIEIGPLNGSKDVFCIARNLGAEMLRPIEHARTFKEIDAATDPRHMRFCSERIKRELRESLDASMRARFKSR